MPWTETHTMQRHRFILACQSGEYSISHLCREFGISRKTAYKWLQRFDPRALSCLDGARCQHYREHPPPTWPGQARRHA
ncbi:MULTISPECIES: helix-turn-helix domain-containing protein [Erwinia]|uniref:helix-turn-helix domain-containing protein n=1 Tax=Erwinia TaxID=551 RepID=UPI00209DAD82|nr:helix-turn-helix domain-containing protein [Erwinia aphidicola]